MKKLNAYLIIFLCLLCCSPNLSYSQATYVPNADNYEIYNGNVTEQLLRNYLKRSIVITDLETLNPILGNQCVDNTGNYPNEYKCWLDFISTTHPKFIMCTANQPGFYSANYGFSKGNVDGAPNPYYAGDPGVSPAPCDFYARCRATEHDIHAIDPQIILAGSITETIENSAMSVNLNMLIPQYVRNDLWNDNGAIPSDPVAQEMYNYFNQANHTIDICYAWGGSWPSTSMTFPSTSCGWASPWGPTTTYTFDINKLFFPWDMQNPNDQHTIFHYYADPGPHQDLNAAANLPGHGYTGNFTSGLNEDITQPQTIALFYYLGTRYIDLGFEAIFMGQVDGIISKYDNDNGANGNYNRHMYYLCSKLRQYAQAHGRRGFVLIGGDCNGLYVGNPADQNLVFDMQVRKSYLKETRQSPFNYFGTNQIWANGAFSGSTPGLLDYGDGINTSGAFDGIAAGSKMPCKNCDYEALINRTDLVHGVTSGINNDPYSNMVWGHNPLGWSSSTNANPYIVWFDNTGGIIQYLSSINPPCSPNTPPANLSDLCLPPHDNEVASFPWSWDEATWYSQESELYRNHFLVYGWNRVRCLSEQSGYLCMPGRLVMAPIAVQASPKDPVTVPYTIYNSYDSKECSGYNQEETIRNIWNANDQPPSSTPPNTIDGQDVRYYNKWANEFEPGFAVFMPTDGIEYFGDFNGDGNVDILETADPNGSRWQGIKLFLNQGNGTFNFSSPDYQGGWEGWGERFYIGDFNGDGKDDFIVTCNIEVNSYWQGYNVFTSNGAVVGGNYFTQSFGDNFPSYGELFYVGDFNGDGYSDFIVTSNPPDNPTYNWYGNELFLNNATSTPSFSMPSGYNSAYPSSGEQFYVGDFNGDGKDDLLVTANRARITNNWLWTGYQVHISTGTSFNFNARGVWPSWGENLAIGDWNKDGFSDMTAIVNQDYFNWQGTKTYLSNNKGNHFIYAFDEQGLGNPFPANWNTRTLFGYKNNLYSVDTHTDPLNPNIITGRMFAQYSVDHCSSTITNSERTANNTNTSGNTNNTVSSIASTDIGFVLAPNPTNSYVNIIPECKVVYPVTVSVKDLSGRNLITTQYSGDISVNMAGYNAGLYIVTIQTGNKAFNYKITKY